MLKIRDDVDLKELEKFGFEKQVKKEKTHNMNAARKRRILY